MGEISFYFEKGNFVLKATNIVCSRELNVATI